MIRYFGRPASRFAWGPVAFLSILLCACGAPAALAHEYWLSATDYRVTRGERVAVSAWVGTGFRGEPKLYADSRTAALDLTTDHRTNLIPLAAEADSHFARVTAPDDSGMVISFLSQYSVLTLPAARFDSYLLSEGLDEVVSLRQKRGHSNVMGKERYRRCAKTWIAGRTTDAGRVSRPVGLPFEIVPLIDPVGNESVQVRLLFEGNPKSGLLVRAWRAPLGRDGGGFQSADRDSTGPVAEARTDTRGEATLQLRGSGEWLIGAVTMIPARKASSDWESYWASLTFGRP
ncbi:MAG: DUF4198 domain-containing protein [Candidatus Eisenbacteria bacterium]|nr:DUF4198 domain-containing protein [Candidatus Eisenbacteria bacterium]